MPLIAAVSRPPSLRTLVTCKRFQPKNKTPRTFTEREVTRNSTAGCDFAIFDPESVWIPFGIQTFGGAREMLATESRLRSHVITFCRQRFESDLGSASLGEIRFSLSRRRRRLKVEGEKKTAVKIITLYCRMPALCARNNKLHKAPRRW